MNAPKLAEAELLAEFAREGDDSGEIWRQIQTIDLCWQQVIIAIDNMEE